MIFRFNLNCFLLFLLLLITEIIIGTFINDSIIRPYGGDYLVIFLVYYFAKSLVKVNTLHLIIAVLLFAYSIEFLQYFKLVELFQIKNKILRIVIGSSFSWGDLIAYTLGAFCCYWIEIQIQKHEQKV